MCLRTAVPGDITPDDPGGPEVQCGRRSTAASPINLSTNNDSELTGTRLQRPMLTDWSSPLAISS
jgi:hypothetical protein